MTAAVKMPHPPSPKNGPETAKRRKLVAYSDSESDSDIVPTPRTAPPAPSDARAPPPPETENDLAGIVIELQKRYTREVEDLETAHREMRREVRAWKARVEDRLAMQVNVMASIIKEVFGVDVNDPAAQRDLQQGRVPGQAQKKAPPSPSPTPSLPRNARSAGPAQGGSVRPASPDWVGATRAEGGVSVDGEAAAATIIPRTRSTGKKAPRPRASGSLRRPYEPKRKQTTKGNTTREASRQGTDPTEDAAADNNEASSTASQPAPIAANETSLPQATGSQNPYDDPKYFSPLMVVDADGVERPMFKFHRHPDTVEEQWAEYKYGLHGQPPVEHLEEVYRAKWRNGTYGRSWFTRRKAFRDKMKELMAEGKTETEALDVMRVLSKGSVPALIAQLCRERIGKGPRPGRKRKCSSSLTGNERERSGSPEDGDAESANEDLEPGRSSPPRLRRKRIRLFKIGGQHYESDDEVLSQVGGDGTWGE